MSEHETANKEHPSKGDDEHKESGQASDPDLLGGDQGELGEQGDGEETKHDEGNDGDGHHETNELDENLPADIPQTSEVDNRSVYVKNVDYSATKEEVQDFFKSCGKINRVTIITDRYTGHPKGFAYIEFAEKEGAENAMILTDMTFKGRTISVVAKRTNVSSRGRGRGRRPGRGFFGTFRRGFGMFGMRPMRRGFRPY